MQLEYRKSQPPTARTWFAVFTTADSQALLQRLRSWHHEISEASTQGTDRDRELWSVATAPDSESWHRAQQHRNQANTLLSVLSGSIQKLESGGDLTAKQLDHVEKISRVMHHFGSPLITVRELTPAQPQTLQDLRDSLFYQP